MQHEQAENQSSHPADIPSREVDSTLPKPEPEAPRAVPEGHTPQDFSASIIGNDPNIVKDLNESVQHDSNEGFASSEQSDATVPEEAGWHREAPWHD